jgi:hypothetical protein
MQLSLLPTELAQWHALVNEAQFHCEYQLDLELESYLVFLLMRFVDQPEIAESVVALDFLEGMKEVGEQQIIHLRDVGDKCLLFSGLFPGLAERRHLSLDYFIDIGQSAFDVIGGRKTGSSDVFKTLSEQFPQLVAVLKALRHSEFEAMLAKGLSESCHLIQSEVSWPPDISKRRM